MSDWNGEKPMNSYRRPKRRAWQLPESSSESDSDISLPRTFKRRRTQRISSDSVSSSSSSSSIFQNHRRRRDILRVMSDSDNGSDSDGTLMLRGGRRKVPRVLNDAESSSESETSGEEIEKNEDEESEESGVHSSSESEDLASNDEVSDNEDEDADWQTDLSSEQDEEIQHALHESLATCKVTQPEREKQGNEHQTVPANIAAPSATGFLSDSSDGESEKCPICLLSFSTQEIGTPESCDHSFCVTCLEEWSKNMTTCPVDRQPFTLILVRRRLEGKVIRKIPVEARRLDDGSPDDDPDPTFCEVCGRSDREDRLLLCDGCDLGYHLECLDPPMETVPVEEWFCQDCTMNNSRIAEEEEMHEGELMELLDDAQDVLIRPRTSRLLPRTRQSERVRATILSRHRAAAEPAMQPSTSGIESLGTESTTSNGSSRKKSSTTPSPRKRRKGVRRQTKKSRKKTTKKKSSKRKVKSSSKVSSKTGDSTTRKTKRRKTRKLRRRKLKVTRRRIPRVPRVIMPLSVKGRLAEQLGMCPPSRPGTTLPVVKTRPTSDIDSLRSRAGIPTLHLFGQRDQLDYFSGSDEESRNLGGDLAVLPRRSNTSVYSARSLASRKALSAVVIQSHRPVSSQQRRANLVAARHIEDSASQTPCDLIGSILDSQSIWHSSKAKVTISRDGSLEVKRESIETAKTGTESNKLGVGYSRSADKLSTDHTDRSGNGPSASLNSNSPLNVRDALGRGKQAPLYPGSSSGSRPPSGGSGFHQFGGNRYGNNSTNNNTSSYQNYQSGRAYSNFSAGSGFDANIARAGYSNYLNRTPPPPPPPPLSFRGSPMRFRLSPRFPLRRPPVPPPRLPVPLLKRDEMKTDDSGEVSKRPQDEEEDEIDIYSDIEMGGVGSGGPSGGGSEPDETDRGMDVNYEALPPPPEPSALLMGLGEQALSDDEQESDSELVIDDNVMSASPHEQSDSTPQIPDSEKYDPAEPSYDSDDDLPLPPSNAVSNEDIPLPSAPPTGSGKSPQDAGISHIVNSSSNSNISYLHSPTYGDKPPFESNNQISAVASDGVVKQVFKEVLKEHLDSTIKTCPVPADAEEEEDEECPNFSIYSALSMDIARKTGEEEEYKETEQKGEEKKREDSEEKREKTKRLSDIEDDMPNAAVIVDESDKQSALQEEEHEEEEESGKTEEIDKDKDSDVEGNVSNSECSDSEAQLPPEMETETLSKNNSESEQISGEHVIDETTKLAALSDELHNVTLKAPSKMSPSNELLDKQVECDDTVTNEQIEAEMRENEEKHRSASEPREISEIPDVSADEGSKTQGLVEEIFGSDDNDSLIGGATSAVSAATMDNNLPVSTPLGLEGLDTETISETEETINFDDDLSQDGNEFLTAEEDGEIPSHKRKKKRKFRKLAGVISKDGGDQGDSEMSPVEAIDYEEGEIVDDRPKNQDLGKKEKKLVDKKDKVKHRDESRKSPDENFDISQSKGVTEEDKKKRKKKSGEKGRVSRERTILGSSENKDKGRDKSRRSEENISWKKPSKSTKGRNYRDGKTAKDDPVMKDKDRESSAKDVGGKKEKKKKEKRKDMERYDVRKVVSDKKRKRRDEFGRDLSRERSVSHSRSRSRRRSRDRSRQRSRSRSKRRSRGRSPVRSRGNRSRSRSRIRSRSRSRVRSRSRSRNRSSRRSKERLRRSRSKDRIRSRISRSHSRGKRSRTRSRSRSKNRQRIRSRSRSVVRSRERKDRTHAVKDTQRFRVRRSWSRTWTPSWSRSRSRSVSCSSYSRSRSPSVRHFNHSYTRSFSRSWSRERHERIPVLEKKTMSKTQKKLTVIVNNTKDDSERQRKKEKKRKENRKNKESTVAVEKRKKRKEKSPAPSKEVFTSGDNILVSVNFNKSNKTSAVKDVPSTALTNLPKDTGKRKRDETFEGDIDPGKKARKTKVVKDKGSPRLKGSSVPEKAAIRSLSEKKSKKQVAKGNKSARMAAILKQKPVAIIDLDQSPFHEQTPSPTDLIVLSDSDETGNKTGEIEEMIEAMSGRRVMRTNSATPPASSKTVHNVTPGMSATRTPESHSPLMSAISNYLVTSTGPKTPPEPQVKFSIAPKPQLRSINNPLLEEEDDMLVEHAGLEDSDQRIEEELDRGLVDVVHKGPNTPPEPRGPTTPCSPPTSPDAYDPFDPTKSGTPSPAGPEASMDGPPSPVITPTDELLRVGGGGAATTGGGRDSTLASDLEELVNKNVEPRGKSPTLLSGEEIAEERSQSPDRTKSRMDSVLTKSPSGMPESVSGTSQLPGDDLSQSGDLSESIDKVKAKSSLTLPSNVGPTVVSESSTISPERKISVVITTQTPKLQGTPVKQQLFPVTGLKQIPVSQQNITSTPNHSNAPAPLFPTLTPANIASILCTPPTNLTLSRTNLFNTPTPISVPPLLQHIASSPAVPTARITADKTPARLPSDKVPGSGLPLRSMVQNGEQQKQPQDTSTEVVDMDLDSPYSPGSSEGDDLFDPPVENTKSNQQSFSSDRSRSTQQSGKNTSKLLGLPLVPLPAHKSPSKPPQDKFDSIFGVSPLRVNKSGATSRATSHQNKSHHKITKVKAGKHGKGGRKEIAIKMDEDQLQILDDLPSSAVELQVKDKFLKKLNRQERVVEEVKLSLKPHYTKKHITKEEYKDILRKSVPKICHNKSGEINPVKISSLVEAYVRKYRYSKKKNNSATSNATPVKPKTFSAPRKTSFTKLDK